MLLVFSSLSPCAILGFNSSCLHAMHGKDIRLNYGYIRGKKKRFTNKTLLVTDPVCWVCSCFFFLVHIVYILNKLVCVSNSLTHCVESTVIKYLNTRSTQSSFIKVSKAQDIVFEVEKKVHNSLTICFVWQSR